MQATLKSDGHLPNALTVAAIAVLAYTATVFIHEALGHGLAAWMAGMKPRGLTSISLELDWANASAGQIRTVGAAGTIANLLAGAIFYLALKTKIRSAHFYCFCRLSMLVNILHGGGYLLINFFFGDWRFVAATFEPKNCLANLFSRHRLAGLFRRRNVFSSPNRRTASRRVARRTFGAGADLVADRYRRNRRIYANITRLADNPNERILVLIGAGHLKLLQQFVEESSEYELERLSKYL